MKRFWHIWLAAIATIAMISPAAAQNGMNQRSEIGSYQSVLSNAGYRGGGDFGSNPSPYRKTGYNAQPGNNAGGDFGGYANRAVGYNAYGQDAAAATPAMQGHMPAGANGANGAQMGPAVNGCANGGCGGTGYDVMSGSYGPMAGSYGAMYGGDGMVGVPCGTNDAYIDGSYGMGNGYFEADYASAPVYNAGYMDVVDGGAGGGMLGGIGAGLVGGTGRNRVLSVQGLFFDRDYEGHKLLSRNPAGDTLFTTDAEHPAMGGFQVDYASRRQNGRGWAFTYWGLYPGTATATLAGAPVYTVHPGFNDLFFGANSVFDIYGQGSTHTVTRDTDINNIEFNLLQNGGCFTGRRGRRASYELLGGFRWFQFDETLNYRSVTSFAGYPPIVDFNTSVENSLLGFQIGGRTEYCLTNRLRFGLGSKVGLFNNNINIRQSLQDGAGNYATIGGAGPYAGQDYDFEDSKNDIAFLGEFDANLYYHFSCRTRAVVGYRVIGVSGLALAGDQFFHDYTDVANNFRVNSNGSLLLHGGHAGLEFCF